MKERWEAREKLLIDLKLLKEWYPKNWKDGATDAVIKQIKKAFVDLAFMENEEIAIFEQLLPMKLFSDNIKTMDMAKDFREFTRKGGRKDTGIQAFKIWGRKFLKKVIKSEFFIMVSTNFSESDATYEFRRKFGFIVDGVFKILSTGNSEFRHDCRIDELFRSYLPNLFRKRYNYCCNSFNYK